MITTASSSVIAVLGSRGGVGTTTLAVNLAATLATDPNNAAALIDLDLTLGDADISLEVSGFENISIADLAATLGMALGHTIWLDANAAGWCWFVDATPFEGEQHHMGLLTALMHEMGHLLGHDHNEGGAMQQTLAAGTRIIPDAERVWDSFVLSLLEKIEALTSAAARTGSSR